jgi:hexosaminidase
VEIKKYPRLVEIGAWREAIGFGLDPGASRNYRADGCYGGYYRQADIRDIVAYAAARHIRIVPEIEMPGHAAAALAAYPEYSCCGTAEPIPLQAGVYAGVFCAGRDETFAFLQDILQEVLALFPGPYVHVGGDEVPKDNWRACPRCQARRRANELPDESRLQSYFMGRIGQFLNDRGRQMIVWDDILEGGLPPRATLMSWRGMAGGVAAARAGHDVVMTPSSHCYFDFPQAAVAQPPAANWAAAISWEKVLEFEPVAADIPAAQRGHVLGGGANLWTEYMPNYGQVEFMAYPRACALAEVLWSPPEARSVEEFRQRLRAHARFLDRLGVRYARPVG